MSLQTRNRSSLRLYKERVAQAARTGWPVAPLTQELELRIVYYHEQSPPDVDNIIKPIQDALVGVVYEDDRQVTDVHSSVRDLNGSFRIAGLSSVLADGFVACESFIHVVVRSAPDHEELLG